MLKRIGILAAVVAMMGAFFAIPASASSTAIRIGPVADRSLTAKIVWVRARVVCTEDTFSASLVARVSQVAPDGTIETNTGALTSINSFECTGENELVLVPVRIPIGGYRWHAGAAAVSGVLFVTQDPTGVYSTVLPKRAIVVR